MKSVVLLVFLISLYVIRSMVNEASDSETDSSIEYQMVKPFIPFKDRYPLEPTMYIKISGQLIPAYPNWHVCYYKEVRPLPQDTRYCIQCSCYLELVHGRSLWVSFHIAGTKEVLFDTDGGTQNCIGVFGSSEYSLKYSEKDTLSMSKPVYAIAMAARKLLHRQKPYD